MKVHIFIPCSVDLLFPKIGVNMVRLLRQQACEVHYNKAQICCGRYPMYMGMEAEGIQIGQKYISDFFVDEPIVCPDSACLSYLKKHLHTLGANQIQNVRATKIQDNLYELTDFLVNVLGKKSLKVPYVGTLAMPDYPIDSVRQKTLNALQKLLSVNEDLTIVRTTQMKGFEVGSDILPLTARKMSIRLLRQYREYVIDDLNAKFFVDADVNALKYFHQYLLRKKAMLNVLHTTDLFVAGSFV